MLFGSCSSSSFKCENVRRVFRRRLRLAQPRQSKLRVDKAPRHRCSFEFQASEVVRCSAVQALSTIATHLEMRVQKMPVHEELGRRQTRVGTRKRRGRPHRTKRGDSFRTYPLLVSCLPRLGWFSRQLLHASGC